MIYNCLRCGVEFRRKYGIKKYCSLSCSRKRPEGKCSQCQKVIRANRVRCSDCRLSNKALGVEKSRSRKRIKANKIARQPNGRHTHLKKQLREENIPQSDLIWNLNFYTALIQDNKCHYCLGLLSPTGHALDRKSSDSGHEANNVVPSCWSCNSIKGKYWEYEHMMLLAPKLRFLRKSGEVGVSQQSVKLSVLAT
jgi:5-methylcytosine-specific restriction endonuclease McrA